MSKKGVSITTVLKKYELNTEQKIAVECIRNNKITVLTGMAGTSKTFTAVYAAMKLLSSGGEIDRVSVTRPLVATEKIGFLPGTTSEKIAPYLLPLVEFFNRFGDSGDKTYSSLVAAGKVVERPLAFMRGSTIENEILIVDEAQGVTPEQMLMVLTRISRTGKLVVTGDAEQSDIKGRTGLDHLVALTKRLPYIQHVDMKENMRDPMIQEIIENWGVDA